MVILYANMVYVSNHSHIINNFMIICSYLLLDLVTVKVFLIVGQGLGFRMTNNFFFITYNFFWKNFGKTHPKQNFLVLFYLL